MSNQVIREAAKMASVKHWQIAESLCISEATLCRWMRKELPQETKQEIFKAIKKIKEAKENAD